MRWVFTETRPNTEPVVWYWHQCKLLAIVLTALRVQHETEDMLGACGYWVDNASGGQYRRVTPSQILNPSSPLK